MKQTLAIIAFASLTLVPPVIAGLRAAPTPQAELPIAGGSEGDFFSLPGAFCSTSPSGGPSLGSNISYAAERTPSNGGSETETDSSGEVAR